MKYIQVQMRIDCPECGCPVPLNGLWLSYHCDNCQADGGLTQGYWIETVKELAADLHEMKARPQRMTVFDEYGTNILFCKTKPRCPHCKAEYQEMEGRAESSFECASCDKPATLMPAPEWLCRALPKIQVLCNAAARSAPRESPEASKPVVFSCLQCGGALKVDGSSRILTCSYCDADNYIPDPLWLRLHPATRMTKWFIGVGGTQGK